ncbi:hypothetical protein GGI35DRAFT_432698 [Trichoderma velutinum]
MAPFFLVSSRQIPTMGDSDYDFDDFLDDLEQLPPDLQIIAMDIMNNFQEWLLGRANEDVPLDAQDLILNPDELLVCRSRHASNSWGFPQNPRARATSRYQYIQRPPARRSIA